MLRSHSYTMKIRILESFFKGDIESVFPEVYLLTITLFLLMVGVTMTNSNKYKYMTLLKEMSLLSSLTLFFTLMLWVNNPFINKTLFLSLFILDEFTYYIKGFIIVLTIGCLLISEKFVPKITNSFEYFIFILFAVFGLLCLVSSFDLISMYVSLELQSLAFYILASTKKDKAFSTEAGLKYLILGAFSSGILLLGISFIYGIFATTSFEKLAKLMIGFGTISPDLANLEWVVGIGIMFILVAILFKLSAAPFHMWAPDVYEGSPLPVTVLFSVVPKIGIFAIAVKMNYIAFYEGFVYWQKVSMLCALCSIIVGTLKALHQNKIKRFLAFSSVSHVGFLLIGFGTGTILGLSSLMFYLVIYSLMMLNIWSIIIALKIKHEQTVIFINDLQGLSKVHPLFAYTLAINLFSMAGIPPLAGFFSKFYILLSGFEASYNIIVIIAILFSVISAFYYLRIIKIIFFDESRTGFLFSVPVTYSHALIMGLTFYFILFLAVAPSPLLLVTQYQSLNIFLL